MQKDTRSLLWNTTALLISYMAVAMPLTAISVFVTSQLGLSNVLGGLAVGIAFLTTILFRGFAGRLADRKGGKACMRHGLLFYATASFICFTAATAAPQPMLSFGLLIAGRLVLGFGESMTTVGMLSWNISLLGSQRSGIVFAVVGATVYGAFAAGDPLGHLALEYFGFSGLMLLCAPLPFIGWLMIGPMPDALTFHPAKQTQSFFRIMAGIWRQGALVGLQGVGFAAIGAFIALYFSSRGWGYGGFALTFFGMGFVLMRLLGGHLPDRLGGVRVSIASLAVEACGQFLLWGASSAEMALIGAFLTGVGYSLVYPSMGVEVVRKVRPELRGTAMGGFAIFQDVAYGATAPIASLFADRFGYSVVFALGLAAATLGFLLAVATFLQKPAREEAEVS